MLSFDSFIPDFGSQKQVTPNVTQVKFGDSYEQRLANGLNTLVEKWPLNFVQRDSTEALALIAFLEARGAVEAFTWTTPDTATVKVFVCRSWTVTPEKGGRFTISAMLERVFEA